MLTNVSHNPSVTCVSVFACVQWSTTAVRRPSKRESGGREPSSVYRRPSRVRKDPSVRIKRHFTFITWFWNFNIYTIFWHYICVQELKIWCIFDVVCYLILNFAFYCAGTAIRHCDEHKGWLSPNLFNCTSVSFSKLKTLVRISHWPLTLTCDPHILTRVFMSAVGAFGAQHVFDGLR